MGNAYIIAGARTPRARGKKARGDRPGGGLCEVHPQELLGQTLNTLAERASVERGHVDDVVIGTVTQAKEQGACIARNAVLAAGWPEEVTGVTLNRFCGSGLQAVNFAAMGVMSGMQQLAVGGGVESMSRVPMGSDEAGIDGHNLHLRERLIQVPQGISADLIATQEDISREELDAFALRSQRRAGAAIADGAFSPALFPVLDPQTGDVLLTRDEHPRPETTPENLAALRPAFETLGSMPAGPGGETVDELARRRYPEVSAIDHRHTAGSSSGIVDGACALLLASEAGVENYGLKPRARVRAMATAGAEPVIMLTAPTPASRKALKMARMEVDDIDLWEINEAFAVVPIKTMRDLGIDPERVNVNGGAIALGHPLGATGAILLQTALDELERRDLNTALVTLCIGGGMGIATVLERV